MRDGSRNGGLQILKFGAAGARVPRRPGDTGAVPVFKEFAS